MPFLSSGRRISAPRELFLFLREYLLILFGNFKNLLVTLVFPAIASLITVWIAGENMFHHADGTKSGCFVLVSAAIWGGVFNSIQTIVKERSMIHRNLISGGMRLSCYVASRALLQLFLCAIQSAIMVTAFPGVSWAYGNDLPEQGILFESPLLDYYISLFLLMYAADALGLAISCVVKKTETASVLAPYILIVQLIFSGILFEMKGSAEIVSYLMLSRWGMEALGSVSELNDLPLRIQEELPMAVHEADEMFSSTQDHLLLTWSVLVLFALGFLVAGAFLLRRVKKDTR